MATSSGDDRIMMHNPNTGREDSTIAVAMYEPVRDAILEALDAEPGMRFMDDLFHAVEARTPADLWADAAVKWYTTTVKLHLEATGLVDRHGSPQQLTLTEAGASELAEIRSDREDG